PAGISRRAGGLAQRFRRRLRLRAFHGREVHRPGDGPRGPRTGRRGGSPGVALRGVRTAAAAARAAGVRGGGDRARPVRVELLRLQTAPAAARLPPAAAPRPGAGPAAYAQVGGGAGNPGGGVGGVRRLLAERLGSAVTARIRGARSGPP